MARLYVAGPLFNAQDRAWLERMAEVLESAGHSVFLPHRDGEDDGASRGPEDESADARRQRIFAADMAGLARADGVVALCDGPDMDAGTAFELGWAYAEGRPFLGIRSDFRTLGPEGPVTLMVYASADRFVHAHDMDFDAIAGLLRDWAATVPPHAASLVRDAVPRLVKDRGGKVRFRQVPVDDRPVALKSKLREAAAALAEADRGDEPAVLADLLEATEAFIRARGFDKETLKAVKVGRWKERGGYDGGWMVDGWVDDEASTDA